MLEKYIYTPEQAKTWREKNEGIKEYYQVTPEQKMKKEFSDSLNRGQISTSPIVPYLSKREFKIRFEERKKNHPQIAPRQDSPTSTEDSGAGDGDGLPF